MWWNVLKIVFYILKKHFKYRFFSCTYFLQQCSENNDPDYYQQTVVVHFNRVLKIVEEYEIKAVILKQNSSSIYT